MWEIDGNQVGHEPFSTEVRAEGVAVRGQHLSQTGSRDMRVGRARSVQQPLHVPTSTSIDGVNATEWSVRFDYTDSPLNHGWSLVDGTAAAVSIDTHMHVIKPGQSSLLLSSSGDKNVGEWSQLCVAP